MAPCCFLQTSPPLYQASVILNPVSIIVDKLHVIVNFDFVIKSFILENSLLAALGDFILFYRRDRQTCRYRMRITICFSVIGSKKHYQDLFFL